jgi:hypothetical protein
MNVNKLCAAAHYEMGRIGWDAKTFHYTFITVTIEFFSNPEPYCTSSPKHLFPDANTVKTNGNEKSSQQTSLISDSYSISHHGILINKNDPFDTSLSCYSIGRRSTKAYLREL